MNRLAALFLFTAACGTDPDGVGQTKGAVTADAAIGPDASTDASAAGPDTNAQPDVPVCNVKPTLKSLEAEYFTSCTFKGCHTTQKHAGSLDLSPGKAWAQLVNVAAFHDKAKAAGLIRVVPGDPEASFAYQKVHGPTAFGALMPDKADAPVDPDCSIAALRAWIEAGALDD